MLYLFSPCKTGGIKGSSKCIIAVDALDGSSSKGPNALSAVNEAGQKKR